MAHNPLLFTACAKFTGIASHICKTAEPIHF